MVRHPRHVYLVILLATPVWSTETTTIDPPPGATHLLLVRLGVGDKAETSWDGSVQVANGELLKLAGYEMRYGDMVRPPARWEARTRKPFQVTPRPMYEETFRARSGPQFLAPAVLLFLRANGGTTARFETARGSFEVRPDAQPVGGRSEHRNGSVTVERLPLPQLQGRRAAAPASGRRADHDFPSVAVERSGAVWTAWQAWDGESDHVLAQREAGPVLEVAAGRGRDIYRTAAAFDGSGAFWVVWAERGANRTNDNWDLYARRHAAGQWSAIERLTASPQPDAQHRLAAGPDGRLHLVWQGWREEQARILYRTYAPGGTGWSAEAIVSPPGGNCWEPAIAVAPNNDVFIAWDQYTAQRGYDVLFRRRAAASLSWDAIRPLAATGRFEAQPSAAAAPNGDVWFAWQESGANWGKDFGYPRDIKLPGTGLYQSRRIHMAVWRNGRLLEPEMQLAEALPSDPNNFHEMPELASDASGSIWCFFRYRTNYESNVPPRVPSHYALWEIYASRFDGAVWSRPILLPYSTGTNDLRMRVAPSARRGVAAAWPTDRRNFRDFSPLLPDVFTTHLEGAPVTASRFIEPRPRPIEATPAHADETGDVAAIQAFRVASGGKQYRIYRGDMHRHTEFSWDGYNDGSLQDAYRYAIDAAGMDYLAVTDHNWGAQLEYDWWRVQKSADLYRIGTRFTPLFGYERSLAYPNGHRNIVFPRRGVRELDNQMNETEKYGGLITGADSLFAYLRRYGGVAMPHTTATNMGTNWRDWGGDVEPLVEIYQGDRNNYESEGSWRSANPNDPSTQHGGYKPDGMVARAWEKGYRLGVQASSDHMATHSSYAMLLAEDNTRESLVNAIRARRAYAATDNIIVDFRWIENGRQALMGEETKGREPARFRVHLAGTAPIGDVQILKNNRVVFASTPNTREVSFDYKDSDPPAIAEADFYYVRLRQNDADRQLAWSSPIWVSRQR